MENVYFKDLGIYALKPSSYYIKKFTPDFYMGMHKHGYFEIMYAQKGSFSIEVASEASESDFSSVTINQGSLIFLDAYLFHRLKISEKEVIIYNIELDPILPNDDNPFDVNSIIPINYRTLLKKTNLKFLTENEQKYMVIPNLCNIDSVFHNLILQLSKEIKSLEDACSVRLAMLSFFNEISKSIGLFRNSETYYTRKIYVYIKNHLNEKITLEDVAKTVGYHKAYLTSQFKKQTGKTIMQTICHMRVSRSLQLLRDTNLSVSDIASQVGFSSYTRMVCAFRKIVGMSPSECRKHFINDEIAHPTINHKSSSIRISPEDYLLDDDTFYASYYKKKVDSTAEKILKKY